jgi:hypothetical protein
MADVQVIIAQPGPLPITLAAEIESDAPVVVTLAGSVWSGTADTMIGVSLLIDGEPSGISASIFSNGPSTHRAVVPAVVPYTFATPAHTFTLEPMNPQTISDSNDRFLLAVQL